MSWSRRVAGVLFAAAVLGALLLANSGVRGTADVIACPSPTPSASPSPTPSPSPSPSPSPTSSPSPDPCATPQPAPVSTPTPSTQAAPAPSRPVPSPPGTPVGSASGPAPRDVTGAVVRDPLLTAVATVLPTPVAQQRPGLLHFAPPRGGIDLTAVAPSTIAAVTAQGALAGGGANPILLATVVVGMASVLVAFIMLLVRRRSLPRSMRLLTAAMPAAFVLPLAALGAGTLLAAAPPAPPVQAAQPLPLASAQPLLKPHLPAALAEAFDTPWSTLLGIENTLSTVHDRLASSDGAIAAVHDALLGAPPDDEHTTHPGGAVRLVRELTTLVAGHHALESAYEQSLQQEYDFFVSTAQSVPQSLQLQTAAARAPAEVSHAVSYDLSTVQTQLAQQAAVNAAAAAAVSFNAAAPTLPRGRMPTFHAPLSGVVTQSFGPSQLTLEPPINYNGVFYVHFHTGLDIAAPLDTPVGATAAGTVILAGASRDSTGALVGYGNYVVISHGNGVLSLYGHLDQVLVQTGQIVRPGQVIGLCGSTGWSTGPHVHFEIRINGQYVDPAPRLGSDLRAPH